VPSGALDTMWYTINNGAKNIILSKIGSIDQSVWDGYGEGIISIKFYANNTYGVVNYKEVNVTKLSEIIERNAYAIIIGISDYPGSNNDLNYCDDDALAVRNMLINDYNFKPQNIIYLEDSNATQNIINNAFSQIESLIDPDDIFYFYYSGHGGSDLASSGAFTYYLDSRHPYPNYYDQTWWISSPDAAYIRVHFSQFDLESGYDYLFIGDTYITIDYYYQSFTGSSSNFWSDWIPVLNDNRIYLRMITDNIITGWGFQIDQIEAMQYSNPHYLCSYDSIPSNSSNYYLDSLLDSKLDSLNCDNKYVVIDACNSGGMIPEAQDENRFIMTACKGGQLCIEEPILNHGIFTYYLLNSLDNATDQNDDGVISMEDSFLYISSMTQSYSSSYGPGIQYHPQLSDGINYEAVLYPSISSISINPVSNRLFYSFYINGHGLLKTLNITVCSISPTPTITIKTKEVKNQIISPTGFGYYWGFIELEEGYIAGGIQILAEIEGYRLIVINQTFGDSDRDGLNDYDEFNGLTDPLNNDTDSDGLLDGEEINLYNTNPLVNDTDLDGVTDYEEINIYSTDPLDLDTDSDNLSDGDEINVYDTDPLNLDTDSDDLSDGDEINVYNTDPLDLDTDSDDLSDGEEIITYNTDPLNADSNSDGITDGEEVNDYGTDPLNGDTDSDTIPDKWEIDNLLNPLVDDTALDPDDDDLINILEYQNSADPNNPDTDGDGWNDGDEVLIYDTDPLDPDSYPIIQTPTTIPGYNICILLFIIVAISLISVNKFKKIKSRKKKKWKINFLL